MPPPGPTPDPYRPATPTPGQRGPRARAFELLEADDLPGAERAARGILRAAPQDPDMTALLGYILLRQKRWAEAEYFVRRTAQFTPEDPSCDANLVQVLTELNRAAEALPVAARRAARFPDDPDATLIHGLTLARLGRHAEALAVLNPALERWPDHDGLLLAVGSAHHSLASVDRAIPFLRRAVALRPDDIGLRQILAIALQYDPASTPAAIRQAHEQWGRLAHMRWPALAPTPLPDPDGPLRIGLLSPDLRGHAVACFLLALLAKPIPGIAFYGYNIATKEDAISARLRAGCAGWVHAVNPKVTAMAERIRADRIDVLIDLAGHTNVSPVAVFAMKPAPVQVSYIGYPSSVGLSTIDARLVDIITDPPGSEPHCIERLARIEAPFLCYTPLEELPPVEPPPCTLDPDGAVTFGTFGSCLKLTHALFQ
ncbi:MAG: tetratricopeptide repeat protein, partial [Phycisphaerales bacterium]